MTYKSFSSWLADKGGATAIEYGLIAAAIAIAISLAVFILGDNTLDLYERVAGILDFE